MATPALTVPVAQRTAPIISVLLLAGMAYALSQTMVFPALPTIADHFDAGPEATSWVLTAFFLAASVATPIFGKLGDLYGKDRVLPIVLGLLCIGSIMCALAPSIGWVIAGRCLQGAGAISAAVVALTADLTRDVVRTRAMAAIGITIGATFAASIVAGPLLKGSIGVPGIFVMTGVLALAAIAVVHFAVPSVDGRAQTPATAPGQLRAVLRDPQLLRLNYGTFALHAVLMALFTQVPFALRDNGLAAERHWIVYLPVLLVSVLLMLPFLRRVDRPGQGKLLMNSAVAVLLASTFALALSLHWVLALCVALTVFFAALNLLEAMLPALVSKYVASDARGAAIGVNSSAQFLGAFAGAAAGGWLVEHSGNAAVFALCVALTALWLAATATMSPPARYATNYSMGET